MVAVPPLPLPQDMHFALPPLDNRCPPYPTGREQQSTQNIYALPPPAVNEPLPILQLSSEALWSYNNMSADIALPPNGAWYQQQPVSTSPVESLFSSPSGSGGSSFYTGTPSPSPIETSIGSNCSVDPDLAAAPVQLPPDLFTSWENLSSLSWFNALSDPTLSLPLFGVPSSTFKDIAAASNREPLEWNGKWAADLII